MAPAISTPVAPPPTMTKVSSRCRSASSSIDLGALEGDQKAPPDLGRVGNVLQPGCIRRPIVMAEIRMSRAGGEHKIIVIEIDLGGANAPRLNVDAGDPRHDHARVLLFAQDRTDRPSDIGRRQGRGCDLIEQWLKAMMVLRVDERHVDGGFGQAFCRLSIRRNPHRRSPPAVADCRCCISPPASPSPNTNEQLRRRLRAFSHACVGAPYTAYGDDRSDNQHANHGHHLEHQFGAFSHRSGRQIYQIGAPRYLVPAGDQVSGRQLSAQALQAARL